MPIFSRKMMAFLGSSFLLLALTAVAAGGSSILHWTNGLAAPIEDRAALAQVDTTFTYQGRLTDNGSPADGEYDFQFQLYDDAAAGSLVAGPLLLENLSVSGGYFTAVLDFGGAFDGTALWLAIAVRPGASTGAYTDLAPRQPLTAAPYALSLRPGAWITGSDTFGILRLANDTGEGLRITSTGEDGIRVDNAMDDGLHVVDAGSDGVHVEDAAVSGIQIDHADEDGIFICAVGTETTCTPTLVPLNNGVEIGNAEDVGVYVGWAGASGLFVSYSEGNAVGVQVVDNDGVYIGSAGNDGMHVNGAGNNGVDVAGDNLAGYFSGDIQVTGSCTGCLLATFGVNSGGETLQPGDLVTVQGARLSEVDSVPMLMEVAEAKAGQTVVGVVGGWAELVAEEAPRPTEIGLRLVPREGGAEPGAYVTIIYSGPVQIRASGLDGALTPGERLTLAADGGVRALQTTEVNGIQIAESAPVVGIALSEPDTAGLVWVLVNPQ